MLSEKNGVHVHAIARPSGNDIEEMHHNEKLQAKQKSDLEIGARDTARR